MIDKRENDRDKGLIKFKTKIFIFRRICPSKKPVERQQTFLFFGSGARI